MRNRLNEIHSKGFDIIAGQQDTIFNQPTGYQGMPAIDFNKIKVGAKILDDAIIKLDGALKNANPKLADKETHVSFGGRLGLYRYYDMDDIIEVALSFLMNIK